jgi:hypothetical protein
MMVRRLLSALLAVAMGASCASGGDGREVQASGRVTDDPAPELTSTTEAAPASSTSLTTATTAPSTSSSQPQASSTTQTTRRRPRPTATTTPPGSDDSWTTSVTGLPGTSGSAATPAKTLPASGRWRPFDPGPLSTRSEALGVWTGKEMLVVGGLVGYDTGTDGAAYDPKAKTWRRIANLPDPNHVVRLGAWTGDELVVWGVPRDNLSGPPTLGAVYTPGTNQWRATAPLPAELTNPQRMPMMSRWTGREVVLYEIGWGVPGKAGAPFVGFYDPRTDTWTVAPPPENATTVGRAVMAGDTLAVLGLSRGPNGPDPRVFLFDRDTMTWHTSPVAPIAIPSYPQIAGVWTGTEIMVGTASYGGGGDGIAYNPSSDEWRTTEVPDFGAASDLSGERLTNGTVGAITHSPGGSIAAYDPRQRAWRGSGPPPGLATADGGVFLSDGKEFLVWGIATDGNSVKNDQPNAAWIWTP